MTGLAVQVLVRGRVARGEEPGPGGEEPGPARIARARSAALDWLSADPRAGHLDPRRRRVSDVAAALAVVEARVLVPDEVDDRVARRAFDRILEDRRDAAIYECEAGWILEIADHGRRLGYPVPDDLDARIATDLVRAARSGQIATAMPSVVASRVAPGADLDPALAPRALPEPDEGRLDLFGLYFAARSTRGRADAAWRARWTEALLARQRTEGCATGSWDPHGRWGAEGGRVYATAMAALVVLELAQP